VTRAEDLKPGSQVQSRGGSDTSITSTETFSRTARGLYERQHSYIRLTLNQHQHYTTTTPTMTSIRITNATTTKAMTTTITKIINTNKITIRTMITNTTATMITIMSIIVTSNYDYD